MSEVLQSRHGALGEVSTRASVSQTHFPPRRRIPTAWRDDAKLASRALNYLWPWPKHAYPGIRKGTALSLGRQLTWGAVRHWFTGRNPLPAWAAEALAEAIEARVAVGAEIAADLRAHVAVCNARLRHQKGRLRGRTTDD